VRVTTADSSSPSVFWISPSLGEYSDRRPFSIHDLRILL